MFDLERFTSVNDTYGHHIKRSGRNRVTRTPERQRVPSSR
jgi:hypothetical protein